MKKNTILQKATQAVNTQSLTINAPFEYNRHFYFLRHIIATTLSYHDTVEIEVTRKKVEFSFRDHQHLNGRTTLHRTTAGVIFFVFVLFLLFYPIAYSKKN